MYIITGATGNVGGKLANMLLEKGKPVRVIGRSKERLKPFVSRGAEPFVGDMEDAEFLTKAFKGGNALFSMIPPNLKAENVRAYYNKMSKSIEKAIKESEIRHVVNLSSIGAHLPGKTGPIIGLHDHEERLNLIRGINVIPLRAGYFMENLMANMGMINGKGIFGSALTAGLPVFMIATRDIAKAAAGYLTDLEFKGKSFRYLLGRRDITMTEAAGILGKALGMPELRYVQFSYLDAEKAMLDMRLSEDIARSFIEMTRALNDGTITEGIRRTPERTTETSFQEFAREFALIYCMNYPDCKASGF
jgi:uncharacterized protein YbjT (DUF2867 family)